MEAVIDDTLRDVLHIHAGRILERSCVYDALVRHQSILPGIQQGIVVSQPPGDIIRVENRYPRRLGESVVAHQGDIRPGNRQYGGAPPGRG
jgi:hypothetical protein